MSTLDEVTRLMAQMTAEEKSKLLGLVVLDLGGSLPGIASAPGVCGGQPTLVRTRIPVWLLERARRLGSSDVELLAAYPMLRAGDLVNAWAYASAFPDEIDRQIQANEAA
jgi:uncharacterized protein (DUF433 family)